MVRVTRPEMLTKVVSGLVILLLEYLASRTDNKVDDKMVFIIKRALN